MTSPVFSHLPYAFIVLYLPERLMVSTDRYQEPTR